MKVLDFGLAKLTDPIGGSIAGATELPTQSLSNDGQIVGTVAYMSPEQAEGKVVGPRSDVFALGIILYELATGERPFKGASTASLLSAILRDTPPPVTATRPTLPPELARVVRRCLEKDPARRLQTALDLRNELEEIRATVSAGATPEVTAPPMTASSRRRRLVSAIALMLVVAMAIAAWELWPGRSDRAGAIDSVAVLPFDNASGSPDADYLADGLAETLTNSLAQIRTLRVVPRTKTLRYRGQTVDLREAGRNLNARAIVTGRIVQHRDRLTVQVELIDAVTEAQLWGAPPIDRPLSDALALQAEIAKGIADKLRPRLSNEDEKQLTPGTNDPTAYRLYLMGRYEWNKRSKRSLLDATGHFERAIQRDPRYALAHAGLAGAYISQGYFGYLTPDVGFQNGMAEARKAIDVNDRLADAHSALATAILYYEWKWPESEHEHQRALEIDPDNADAHFRYAATLLRSEGRFDDAITQLSQAASLDPTLPVIPAGLGLVLTYAHRYDEAIVALKQALELDSTFVAAHRDLASAYRLKGMGELAISESQQAISMGEPSGKSSLAQSYVVAGKRADAVALLNELTTRPKGSPGAALGVAAVYAALGNTTNALDWLKTAFADHDPNLVFLRTNPEFNKLYDDPRFKDLVQRIGIPTPSPR